MVCIDQGACQLIDHAFPGIRHFHITGTILADIAHVDYSKYIERSHNLEGLRRLALLKVLSHRQRVLPEWMQRFLDAHAKDLGNPYTDGPMNWDPKKGSIYFMDVFGKKPVEIF